MVRAESAHAEGGYVNHVSGMGTGGSDASTFTTYERQPLVPEFEARNLWDGNDMAARVVEMIPREADSPGTTYMIDGEPITELIESAYRQVRWHVQGRSGMGLRTGALHVEFLARAFGGGLIVGGFGDQPEDAQGRRISGREALRLPLTDDTLPVQWVRGYQRWEAWPIQWDNDPSSINYGRPSIYQVAPRPSGSFQETSFQVHYSRCIPVYGPSTESMSAAERQGWGDSIFRRLRIPLRIYGTATLEIESLFEDLGVFSLGLNNLSAMLSRDGSLAHARARVMARAKGRYNAVVHDADKESVGFHSPSLAGVSDLYDRACTQLAAAVPCPVTKLMGISPAGLSTDDASGTRNWHDTLSTYRTDVQTPLLQQLAQWVLPATGRSGHVVVKQNALGAPSHSEQAEDAQKLAAALKAMVESGISARDALTSEMFTSLLPDDVITRLTSAVDDADSGGISQGGTPPTQ